MIRSVIVLAAIDWNFLQQRPQHLASAMAAQGLDILFVENTGTRMPRLHDFPRLVSRLERAAKPEQAQRDVPTGVRVLSPLLPPFPYQPAFRRLGTRWLIAQIDRYLRSIHATPDESALVLYLATPLALEIANCRPWAVVCYDIVSDPSQADSRVKDSERRLIRRADLVLFASQTLGTAYNIADKGQLFQDGFPIWEEDRHPSVPAEVATLPHPILLYLGGINRKLWPEALDAMCEAAGSGSVLLVGPVSPGEFRLPPHGNTLLLPPLANYQDLSALLRIADVGIVPYRNDAFSGRMHPAKLAEYMSAGLPTVATQTEELLAIQARWPAGSLYLGADRLGLVQAVTTALKEDSAQLRERRRHFARERTWAVCADELIACLSQASTRAAMP